MTGAIIITKEHRRFTEFADAVRKQRTIGICFGPAGVGKTLSARRYANWDLLQSLLETWGPPTDDEPKIGAAANRSRTVFYTPRVQTTPKAIEQDIDTNIIRTERCIEEHLVRHGLKLNRPVRVALGYAVRERFVELIIIDESERLNATALELMRDRYDRTSVTFILIGMPGIEKQFSHYPQLYSRLGFAHQYRPLGHDELQFVLDRHRRKLGKTLDLDDFTDAQAFAAVERITRGNFRLLERLFPQIERVLKINDLDVITNDVIEAARSTLVIGTT